MTSLHSKIVYKNLLYLLDKLSSSNYNQTITNITKIYEKYPNDSIQPLLYLLLNDYKNPLKNDILCHFLTFLKQSQLNYSTILILSFNQLVNCNLYDIISSIKTKISIADQLLIVLTLYLYNDNNNIIKEQAKDIILKLRTNIDQQDLNIELLHQLNDFEIKENLKNKLINDK